MFTALREIIAAFAGPDPHLGLYGAFGYDLAFQFEPVRLRHRPPADQRDLVLHLPDQMLRGGPQAGDGAVLQLRVRAGRRSTAGLARATAPRPGAGGAAASQPCRAG